MGVHHTTTEHLEETHKHAQYNIFAQILNTVSAHTKKAPLSPFALQYEDPVTHEVTYNDKRYHHHTKQEENMDSLSNGISYWYKNYIPQLLKFVMKYLPSDKQSI